MAQSYIRPWLAHETGDRAGTDCCGRGDREKPSACRNRPGALWSSVVLPTNQAPNEAPGAFASTGRFAVLGLLRVASAVPWVAVLARPGGVRALFAGERRRLQLSPVRGGHVSTSS